jgi:TatD DNase family protein
MSWIDSHCHLKSFYQKKVLDVVLRRAMLSGVEKMITVGTNKSDWSLYQSLSQQYLKTVFYTVGLHPCYVDDNWVSELEGLSGFWSLSPSPVALGEIGLDYFRLPKNIVQAEKIRNLQKECFSFQLGVASDLGCPVIIHARNAFDDCVRLIDESGLDWSNVVFHCFSEGMDEIEKLINRGGYASFTAIVRYKNNDQIRSALKKQGIDRLMLETDSPYLPVNQGEKKANEPSAVPLIGESVSLTLEKSVEDLACKTTSLAQSFFSLYN